MRRPHPVTPAMAAVARFWAATLAAAALPLLMLLPSVAGWLTAPLILTGLVLALRERRLEAGDREFLLVTGLIPASYLLNMAIFGGDFGLLERPGHLLRGFLIYFAISRLGLPRGALVAGIAAAALTAAAISLHAALILHEPRVFGFRGHWNAVPFGNFALLLGLLSLLAAAMPRERPGIYLRLTAGVACLGGLTASLLSGSRGGWLSLPLLLPALAWLSPPPQRQRWIGSIAGLGLVAAIALAALPGARLRLTDAVDEIRGYHANPDAVAAMSTSSGQRLAMWTWGLARFREHPLLGFGIANFPRERAAAVARGELPPAVESLKLANVHNELIGSLAGAGIVGAASLIGFWLLGWRYFRRRLAGSADQRYFAACGLLVLLATGLFSMTEGLFGTGPGTKALMLLLALPAAGLAGCERSKASQAAATTD